MVTLRGGQGHPHSTEGWLAGSHWKPGFEITSVWLLTPRCSTLCTRLFSLYKITYKNLTQPYFKTHGSLAPAPHQIPFFGLLSFLFTYLDCTTCGFLYTVLKTFSHVVSSPWNITVLWVPTVPYPSPGWRAPPITRTPFTKLASHHRRLKSAFHSSQYPSDSL